MAAITQSRKSISFVYDFAVNGGTVGTFNMGVFLPQNVIIYFGYAKVVTTLTSGGLATLAIGVGSATFSLVDHTAVSNFTAGAIIPGIDLLAAPKTNYVTNELTFTIEVANLTAGKLVYYCQYAELASNITYAPATGIGAMIIGSTFIVA